MFSLTVAPLRTIVREPCGRQMASAYSHSWPLTKLLLGQAIGPVVPSVVGLTQLRKFGLLGFRSQGPSPAFCPLSFGPPAQVSKVFVSTRPAACVVRWLVSFVHSSLCPISCSISTPPCSAAQGTWFCCAAVLYSAWKVNGEPAQ